MEEVHVARILNEEPAENHNPPPLVGVNTRPIHDKRNDRLSAVVAGENSKNYLGKEYTITEIENLSVDEQDKVYT